MGAIIPVLKLSIYVIIGIMLLLVLLYFYLMKPKVEKKSNEPELIEVDSQIEEEKAKRKEQDFGRFHGDLTRESIFDFMEFDEIVDDMIIRKKGTQYIMVIQCNGVNYDLMSEQEKIGVEEGFVQFLNTKKKKNQCIRVWYRYYRLC